MSNLYRGPYIAATYQVSVHLAKRFQRIKLFMSRPISNTNCLCWPCLLTKLAIFIEGLPPLQTWSTQAILVADWPIPKKIFYSETAWPNEPKRGR
jgi:hypothetical protein